MKLYTQTGDQGTTSLYSGERVSKNHPQIEAVGTLDELTTQLGAIRSVLRKGAMADEIKSIQKTLVLLMSETASATSGDWQSKEADIQFLERRIDDYQEQTGSYRGFVLPGDNPISAKFDVARTVARRAERTLIACENLALEVKKYVNRLSDYLYAAGRYVDKVFEETMKSNYQLINEKLDLETANTIIEKVKEYATYKGIAVVIAVVTQEGNPISIQAMDDAFVISYELAIKKAFTSAALKMPTHELGKLTAEGGEFEGLEGMLDAKIITLGGGYPLEMNGKVIGAIGVSGGSAKEDIDFARYGAECLKGV